MLKIKVLIGFILLLSSFLLSAAIDVYQFDDPEKEGRFQKLAFELRCPKCQNQNIADSNAEIAKDLRTKIQQMLIADKSDMEIVDYMVERYGDFVLYEPRVKPQTYLLWYGPALFLVLGLIIIILIIRSRNKTYQQINENESSLSDSESEALHALLKTNQEKK
ncbi:cytochrome c-type biogenesis protein CcmH [Bathymodiolus platifrons methanotrophic gill symbiont]|uniref:cytochrome c-type biogenesis protein n=1 Tax=Bathymodiolus platifrons methanotrophic gill symbiont TaxID=113268 RepID=UPI000B7306D2|nr:cytochrome c-type biogenesis protein [Bathymodiolus platifrons methanotrophic gill symbiont]MCK5869791.1 cytochrome c-type biogenesis protein CcmH [Methyloprofundus sp.]GAW86937.1 cytochrome c-type biogenesis protein CcmH [Bathymodiolus platifrons methanotrophic gill symbiont]GFO74833.1 cytochrome c-type biogenesis protein CcmH [Bathymodiolus platifrons methanotrophic gill symbiont]